METYEELKKEERNILEQESILNERKSELYAKLKELKKKEFDNCRHIFVVTHQEYDYYEGRRYIKRGCIKCGLNQVVLDAQYTLSMEEEIAREYLCNNEITGLISGSYCDLNLGHSLYQKIKEAHPDFSDEEVLSVFEIMLAKAREENKGKSR